MDNTFIFVGWARGQFDLDDGSKQAYYNMYVISPVSTFSSEDYEASGYKAEKLKCVSPAVWDGLTPGDHVQLFFDSRKRVAMVALAE